MPRDKYSYNGVANTRCGRPEGIWKYAGYWEIILISCCLLLEY